MTESRLNEKLTNNESNVVAAVLRRYQAAFAGLPREVWLLSLVMLVNRAGSMVMSFLSLYCSRELELGDIAAGQIMAFFGLGSCVGSLLGGYLTRQVGPFRIQCLSLVLNGLGFAVLSQMSTFWSIAITIFFTSMAADMFRPANGTAIALIAPPALHKRSFALNRLAVNLGFTIGPLVGGVLAAISYQFLFWIDVVTCLGAAAVLFVSFRSHFGAHQEELNADNAEALIPTKSPWGDGRFLIFLMLTVITFMVFFQLISTFPLFLTDELQLTTAHIGLLFALNTIVVVVFEMVLIHAIDLCNVLRTIAWGALLMCLGFGLLPLGTWLPDSFSWRFSFVAITVLVWTVGEMLGMPQMFAYVSSITNRENRSRYMGLYTASVAASLTLGPLVGTWMYARSHYQLWYWSAAIGFLALGGYYLLDVWPAKPREVRQSP